MLRGAPSAATDQALHKQPQGPGTIYAPFVPFCTVVNAWLSAERRPHKHRQAHSLAFDPAYLWQPSAPSAPAATSLPGLAKQARDPTIPVS